MDFIEISEESWKIYKEYFSTFVLPFLVLALFISVTFNFISFKSSSTYLENGTLVVYGEGLNSKELLDSDDRNYFNIRTTDYAGIQRLEVIHISESLSNEDSGNSLKITLNFKSENLSKYRFDIYNFSERFWENGVFENVGRSEKTWFLERTKTDFYLEENNSIKVRLISENVETIVREDYLSYEIIGPPGRGTISINFILLALAILGLTACSGMVIVITWNKMMERALEFREVFERIGKNYHQILLMSIPFFFLLSGSIYLLSSFLKGITMILFGLILLFLSAYAWPHILINSESAFKGLKKSFEITRRSFGTTLILWFIIIVAWLLSGSIPVLGNALFWIFLPFWIVLVTVTYTDKK